jgi:hypothetical protein
MLTIEFKIDKDDILQFAADMMATAHGSDAFKRILDNNIEAFKSIMNQDDYNQFSELIDLYQSTQAIRSAMKEYITR